MKKLSKAVAKGAIFGKMYTCTHARTCARAHSHTQQAHQAQKEASLIFFPL